MTVMVTQETWRIAVVVNVALPLGALANTVGVVGVGLGAALPALAGATLTDEAGRAFHVSSNRPLPVLQADVQALSSLFARTFAAPEGAIVVPFPAFARALHAYADYVAAVANHDFASEPMDAIGLAGPDRWVRSLTGSLKLLR